VSVPHHGGVLAELLPATVDNSVRGSRIPLYVFAPIVVVSVARSLIHLFAPDSGAGSIAGVDLSAAGPLGARGIVFFLAQWGGGQLVLAFAQVLVLVRYRSLVPLFYLLLLAEIGLRMLVGHIKPMTFGHVPPGQVGNYALLAIALAMLALSLRSSSQQRSTQAGAGVSR
jgi:hypothetical protein